MIEDEEEDMVERENLERQFQDIKLSDQTNSYMSLAAPQIEESKAFVTLLTSTKPTVVCMTEKLQH